MNAMQIEFCAENILEKMWMYSLEDVQLCLDRGAIGDYGPIYNRIDPATILEWFPKYDAQRAPFVDAIRMEKEQQNNIYEIFQHPQIESAMKDVYDKIAHKEAPQPEAKRTAPSAFEQQLLSEYDALPEWKESRWFKVYQNKPYQFTEYRKQRYMEEINNQNEY
jgi:hypothetical protein